MKQLAIWFFGLIECLILLMMKFIKVLEGEICTESAAKSGKIRKLKFLAIFLSFKAQALLTLAYCEFPNM